MDRVDSRLATTLNANVADLSAFRQRGGRLMIYTGLADPAVPADEVVHYYERVTDTASGLTAARSFARLFLVPGMGHCFGGPGMTDIGQPFTAGASVDPANDALSALVAWAEGSAAPDRLLATRAAAEGARSPAGQQPVCAYPALPQFTGGDPAAPGSFACTDRPRGARNAPALRYLD
jgi:feruloyl esterase